MVRKFSPRSECSFRRFETTNKNRFLRQGYLHRSFALCAFDAQVMKLRYISSRCPFLNNYINNKKTFLALGSQMRASSVCASCLFCILISIIALSMARSRSLDANCHGKTLVPFSLPGLELSVYCALDINLPLQAAEIRLEETMDRTPARPPQTAILRSAPRLLIAVTTGCCQQLLLNRRKAIRETWIATMRENGVVNVDVAFFIAQPPNTSLFEIWAPLIEVCLKRWFAGWIMFT